MSHRNLPLHRLFTALQTAGLYIGPAERLRVQQLLSDSPAAWQTDEGRNTLMYELAPLLCRNRVEQEAFYKAYEAFLAELAMPIVIDDDEKPDFWKQYGPKIAWVLGVLALVAGGWWGSRHFQEKEMHLSYSYGIPGNTIVSGYPVNIENISTDVDTSTYRFQWFLKEIGSKDTLPVLQQVSYHFNFVAPMPSNGNRANFEVLLQAVNRTSGAAELAFKREFEVVNPCDNPPKVQDTIRVEGKLQIGQKIKLLAPKGIKKHWRVDWEFGERDFSKNGQSLDYSRDLNPEITFNDPGRHLIALTISDTTQAGFCSIALTKEIFIQEDIPTLRPLQLYKDTVKPIWTYTRLSIVLALLAFVLAARFAWRWWRRPGITIPPPAPPISDALKRAFESEPKDTTPYNIPHRSNNSQIRIAAEQIELANTFRRRQEGQVASLHIPLSISATIEKLGYAELRFSYNTRPTHYLFLIDLQNESSHQAQLFRYIVEMLEGQDVLADVFLYKNDLSRCWNRLHPEGLSLDQLALQYADRRLVVFGDGYRLLLEHEAAHKDLFDTLRRWPQRMLLTPVPVASWTYREARLYQLWAVFQADLGGLMQAARFVENGMDDENLPPTFAEWQRQCRRSEIDADTDRDWDTPAEHRDYLREAGDRDNALYRWLRALSVYPELNWNVTIAIGKALGIDVRYEHLLTLARIPWLQAGAMKPSLWRAWMREMPLPDTAPDETLAREAVRAELRAVETLCADGYADRQMQTRLAVQDFALAPAERSAQDNLYYVLQHIIPAPLLREELDRAVERHIPDFKWTGDGKTGRAVAYLQAGQPTPTVQRPFWTRDLLYCVLCWPFFLMPLLVSPARWAPLYERYPALAGLFVAPQEDEAVRLNNLAVEEIYNDSTISSYVYKTLDKVPGDELVSRQGDFYPAFRMLSDAIALRNGDYPLVETNRAKIFFNSGLVFMASADFTEKSRAGSAAETAQKERDRGIAALHFAQKNDSLQIPAAEALAIAFYQNNQPDSACSWMQQLLALKPDAYNWLAEKGLCTTCRQVINVNYSVALRSKDLTMAEINDINRNQGGNVDRQTMLGTIALGETVELLDSTQNFWKVRYGAKTGYVAKTINGRPLLGPCGAVPNRQRNVLPVRRDDPDPAPPDLRATLAAIADNMVPIKGGAFRMGSDDTDTLAYSSEKPAHEVTLSDFYMGRTEVTNAQFAAFLNEKGNQEEGGVTWINLKGSFETEKCRITSADGNTFTVEKGYENHPVIYVSWYGARAFCQWLSQKTGKQYRLPTEAEWEYAARGGTDWAKGFQYAGSNTLDEVAWYDANSYDKGAGHPDYGTHRVAQKKPNQRGLFDMSGNVWEWCSDWFDAYQPEAQRNPTGPTDGSVRVRRGGSCYSFPRYCRVAYRFSLTPDYRYNGIGFRLLRAD